MSDVDEDDLAAWGRWNADRVADLTAENARLRAQLDQIRQWLFENRDNPLRLMQVDELDCILAADLQAQTGSTT